MLNFLICCTIIFSPLAIIHAWMIVKASYETKPVVVNIGDMTYGGGEVSGYTNFPTGRTCKKGKASRR